MSHGFFRSANFSGSHVHFRPGAGTRPLPGQALSGNLPERSRVATGVREGEPKRTHWSYLACFEVITAKERSNSGNSVRHAPGLAPRFPVKAGPESTMPQSDPGMSFILRRKGFVGALTHPDSCSQGAGRSAMRPEDVICIVSTSPY